MSKVLYIKANPKSEEDSFTFKVSELFIRKYQEEHPDDEVETLDLYKTDIDFLRADDLTAMMSGGSEKMKQYAMQFVGADKIVIASPMWNFGVPAILKAYIDYILLSGVTFQYGENGPEGLTKDGVKILHVTARGGSYIEAPMDSMEMSDKYIRAVAGFVGITDVETIAIEKIAMGEAGQAELESAKEKAENLAKNW